MLISVHAGQLIALTKPMTEILRLITPEDDGDDDGGFNSNDDDDDDDDGGGDANDDDDDDDDDDKTSNYRSEFHVRCEQNKTNNHY